MEELRQRFAIAQPEEKVKVLADAFNYGEAGIDLLIEALNDDALTVRAIAYQLLQGVESEKAKQAIANGILLNEGDRVYSVYKWGIWFTDEYYVLFDASSFKESEVIDSIQKHEVGNGRDDTYVAKRLSTHVSKAIAESIAELIHQKMSRERDIEEFDLTKTNHNFNLEEWCLANNVPYKNEPNFEDQVSNYLFESGNYELDKKLWEARYPKFDLAAWCIANNIPYKNEEYEWEFLNKIIENMKVTENYELLGKLWKDAVGSFAFVHEKVIKQKTYLK